MSSLAKVRKLASMPASEIVGRLRTSATLAAERVQHATVGLSRQEHLREALSASQATDDRWRESLLAARRRARPRFFLGTADRAAARNVFANRFESEAQKAEAWADRALRHQVHFFGSTYSFGARIPWHEDPESKRPWPKLLHQSLSVHVGDTGHGDVKYVWELNRHQFIADLGKAFFLTGRGEFAREARLLVTDWIEENPFAIGVNWASPLEPAYRALSWLWAYYFTIDDPAFDAASHARWVEGFYDAGRFLNRHLELYASPFNHLLGELTALYAIGTCFPEFRLARAWRQRAKQLLVERLPAQFYADGGTVEQATCYHHASLGFYLLAALLGRANDDEFPSNVWQAIERATAFSAALIQPDGTMPAIGDNDDARPVLLERRPLWDERAFLSVGAVLFGRGDLKRAAGRFHEDAWWLLGPEGAARFDAIEPTALSVSIALRESGYVVMRGDVSSNDYVCFDCGEQAGGLRTDAIASAAHGHADCLSVVAWLGGKPIIVDPGLFTYNADREWERYFRGTGAHSTVRVDGRDQSVHLEKMAWMEIPRATLEQFRVDGAEAVATGSHDGYLRRAPGVLHRRTVWLRPGGYVVIYDELAGEGQHEAELNFQLAPGEATLDGSVVTLDGAASLHVFASQRLTSSVSKGGASPGDGWIAPGLGVRVPAPRVRFVASFGAPGLSVLTIATDLVRAQCAPLPGEPLAAVITGDDFVDVVIGQTPNVTPLREGAALNAAARVGVLRLQNGLVAYSEDVNGLPVVFDERWVQDLTANFTSMEHRV